MNQRDREGLGDQAARGSLGVLLLLQPSHRMTQTGENSSDYQSGMIHRLQGGRENQGNLVVLEYQGHHFSQEYQEGLDLLWGLEVLDH